MVAARGRIGGRLFFFFANVPNVSERRRAQAFTRARRKPVDGGHPVPARFGLDIPSTGRQGIGVDASRTLIRRDRPDDVLPDGVEALVAIAEFASGPDVAALGLSVAARGGHLHDCARGLDRDGPRRNRDRRGGRRHRRNTERSAGRLRCSLSRSSCRPTFLASSAREGDHGQSSERERLSDNGTHDEAAAARADPATAEVTASGTG